MLTVRRARVALFCEGKDCTPKRRVALLGYWHRSRATETAHAYAGINRDGRRLPSSSALGRPATTPLWLIRPVSCPFITGLCYRLFNWSSRRDDITRHAQNRSERAKVLPKCKGRKCLQIRRKRCPFIWLPLCTRAPPWRDCLRIFSVFRSVCVVSWDDRLHRLSFHVAVSPRSAFRLRVLERTQPLPPRRLERMPLLFVSFLPCVSWIVPFSVTLVSRFSGIS